MELSCKEWICHHLLSTGRGLPEPSGRVQPCDPTSVFCPTARASPPSVAWATPSEAVCYGPVGNQCCPHHSLVTSPESGFFMALSFSPHTVTFLFTCLLAPCRT